MALFGLSYKREIPDLRESPAIDIRDMLTARGATVKTFDPYAPRESSASSIEDALVGADAAVLATDHAAFETITPSTLINHNIKVLVDGKNFFSKEQFTLFGITYRGIGR